VLDPKFGMPHLGLALVFHDLGREEESTREHALATTLDPRIAHSNGDIEKLLQAEGRLDVRVESRHASEKIETKSTDAATPNTPSR
jgi:hypothetical protein